MTQKENHIDMITKLNFIYEDAMAGAIVSIHSKAEGDLVISGTKGYIYVPAPWWKTEFLKSGMKISIKIGNIFISLMVKAFDMKLWNSFIISGMVGMDF